MSYEDIENELWKISQSKKKGAKEKFGRTLIAFALESARIGLEKGIALGRQALTPDGRPEQEA